MSNESGRRTLWRALGLYAAGSWVLLQVVDVLTQNIPLPSWVFLLTLGLLAAGLPVTVATAVIQGRGAAQAGESASAAGASGAHRIFTWANVVRGGVVALAVWGVAVTGWLLMGRDSGDGWDVVAGLEEIERLTNDANYSAAYEIAWELVSPGRERLRTHRHVGAGIPDADGVLRAAGRHGLSARLRPP